MKGIIFQIGIMGDKLGFGCSDDKQLNEIADKVAEIEREYHIGAKTEIIDNIMFYFNEPGYTIHSSLAKFKDSLVECIESVLHDKEVSRICGPFRNALLLKIYNETVGSVTRFAKTEKDMLLLKDCYIGYVDETYLDYIDEEFDNAFSSGSEDIEEIKAQALEEIDIDGIIEEENSAWMECKDTEDIMLAIGRFKGYCGEGEEAEWFKGLGVR